jgi:gas vesicle protein
MRKTRTGDGTGFFLLGAVAGAAVALLAAPASGARTRRRLLRKGEEAADYMITAGKDLIDKCEDLYERSEELVEDTSHELSGKYRALLEYSKQAVGEAEAILQRTKMTVSGR